MKSYDYDACAYDGAIYCNECLPDGITPEHDECSPVFADSEHDSYPVCDACGYQHDYVSLTSDGFINEAEAQHAKIFYMAASEFSSADKGSWMEEYMNERGVAWDDPESVGVESTALAGWYIWCCLPGCMPDSDARGPYSSANEAAQAYLEYA